MTIIEVLFAIVILSGVMLSLSRFGQSFTRASRDAAHLAVASDLAAARLEAIRGHPVFATIRATFNGAVETSATGGAVPAMTGYDGYRRTTAITVDSSATVHVLRVTVTVTAPGLSRAVAKTVVISAF
jgi:Tfp pilus assembly protein PilV